MSKTDDDIVDLARYSDLALIDIAERQASGDCAWDNDALLLVLAATIRKFLTKK